MVWPAVVQPSHKCVHLILRQSRIFVGVAPLKRCQHSTESSHYFQRHSTVYIHIIKIRDVDVEPTAVATTTAKSGPVLAAGRQPVIIHASYTLQAVSLEASGKLAVYPWKVFLSQSELKCLTRRSVVHRKLRTSSKMDTFHLYHNDEYSRQFDLRKTENTGPDIV